MPLARYESIDSTLKGKILDVSKQEFATHGYEDASYNKIIQKIGISKGSMYYYFENKEDLFITCFLDEARTVRSLSFEIDGLSELVDHDVYWNSIQTLSAQRWKASFQHPRLMNLMHQVASLGSEHPIVRKLNNACEGLIEYNDFLNILEQGVQIDAVRSDVPLQVLLRMSTEYELWLLQEMRDEHLGVNEVVSRSFEMFKQLFETKGE